MTNNQSDQVANALGLSFRELQDLAVSGFHFPKGQRRENQYTAEVLSLVPRAYNIAKGFRISENITADDAVRKKQLAESSRVLAVYALYNVRREYPHIGWP